MSHATDDLLVGIDEAERIIAKASEMPPAFLPLRLARSVLALHAQLAAVTEERDASRANADRLTLACAVPLTIVRKILGAVDSEATLTAAQRVVRERDDARRMADDPTKDDSDEAHPAWWRGCNAMKVELTRAVAVAHAEARGACARVALLEAERDDARTKLHTAETELARLRESLRVATPEDRMIDSLDAIHFTPNACMDWIRAHRAEMAQHVGRHVVIHADRGIIAMGDDPVMLEREHGNTEGDLMVTFVSPVLDDAPGEVDAPDCQVRRGVPSKSGGA